MSWDVIKNLNNTSNLVNYVYFTTSVTLGYCNYFSPIPWTGFWVLRIDTPVYLPFRVHLRTEEQRVTLGPGKSIGPSVHPYQVYYSFSSILGSFLWTEVVKRRKVRGMFLFISRTSVTSLCLQRNKISTVFPFLGKDLKRITSFIFIGPRRCRFKPTEKDRTERGTI